MSSSPHPCFDAPALTTGRQQPRHATAGSISRRRFVLGLGATAAIALTPRCGTRPSPSPPTRLPPRLPYPFTLGVASGEPSPDGVVLWTRLAPNPLAGGGMPERPVPVQWQVGTDEHFRHVVAHGIEIADPAFGHSVHAEVEDCGRHLVLVPVPRRRRSVADRSHPHRAGDGLVTGEAVVRRDLVSALHVGLLHRPPAPRRRGPRRRRPARRLHLRDRAQLDGPSRRTKAAASRSPSSSTATVTPSTRATRTCRPRTPRSRGWSCSTTTRSQNDWADEVPEDPQAQPPQAFLRPSCRRLTGVLRAHAAAAVLAAPGHRHPALPASDVRRPPRHPPPRHPPVPQRPELATTSRPDAHDLG